MIMGMRYLVRAKSYKLTLSQIVVTRKSMDFIGVNLTRVDKSQLDVSELRVCKNKGYSQKY